MDSDFHCCEFWRDGVPVPAPIDQRLPCRGAFLGHDHREYRVREWPELLRSVHRFRGRVPRDGLPAPQVLLGSECFNASLRLLEGEIVGEGPPPTLRNGVVVLLDHSFAVP